VPIGNTLPDAGTEVRLATEQLSDAVTENGTATPCGLVALTTMGAGHVMTGFSVSWTVTVNVQGGDGGPDRLSAWELTVDVPTANVLPEGGEDTADTSGHMPDTAGENVTAALH